MIFCGILVQITQETDDMARFSKAAAADQIRERANGHGAAHELNPRDGTSQLWPRGCDQATKDLIAKAVAYGAMVALHGVAQDIEGGHIGMTEKQGAVA